MFLCFVLMVATFPPMTSPHPHRLLTDTGGQLGGGGRDEMGVIREVAALGVMCIVW